MLAALPPDAADRFALDRLADTVSLDWLEEMLSVHPLEAGLLMVPLGVALLLYGFRLYRWLVILAYAVAGGILGIFVTGYFGANVLLGMVAGALVLGLLAWPLHRLGLGLLGGFGLALAASVLAGVVGITSQVYGVMAVVVAFVGGTVVTLLLLRPLIIVSMALTGAILLAEGALRLVLAWPSFGEPMLVILRARPYLFGIAVVVLAVVGSLLQFADTKGEKPASKKNAAQKG